MYRDLRKEILIGLISGLVLTSLFILPKATKAAFSLPTSGCDQAILGNADTFMYGFAQAEDGTKLFTYGSGGVFLNNSNNVLSLGFDLIGIPEASLNRVSFKLDVFDASCRSIAGVGTGDNTGVKLTGNVYSLSLSNFRASFNGQDRGLIPAMGTPRYIVFEAVDGYPAHINTHTYVIDITNIQNPVIIPDPVLPPPPPTEPPGKRPVLIIPGIMGSELYEGDDLIWPNVDLILDRVHDYFLLESLGLDENGKSIKNIDLGSIVKEIKIDKFNITYRQNTFISLIAELEQNNYVNNESYFFFPYDWRLDIDETKLLLKNKIQQIKNQTHYDKVDIVAHSMGGLVVKDYINDFDFDSINKLIFVGTPHLGAPKAANVLLSGDVGIPLRILNFETMKQLSINSPSVYELLPNHLYHQNYDGYFRNQDGVILDYNESNLLLADQGMNSLLLDKSDQFFSKDLDKIEFTDQVFNISGCGEGTQGMFHLDNTGNVYSVSYINGDGTVPLVSSWYALNSKRYYVKNGGHSSLPSLDGVRQSIVHILNNEEYSSDKVSKDIQSCDLKGKKLTWRSPVEIHIYDANNNHAGSIENGFENNIPGVQYDIINHEKFIFLPTNQGQEYRIEGIGEDTGSFDLIITNVDNDLEGQSELFDNIQIVPNSFVSFNITEDSDDSQINFDFDNSGDPQIVSAMLFDSEEEAFVEAMAEPMPEPEPAIEPVTVPQVVSNGGGGGGGLPSARIETPKKETGNILGEVIERIPDGTLVLDSSDARTIYMLGDQGKKYGFTSTSVFLGQGFKFENVVSGDIVDYELGGVVSDFKQAHPNGTLITDGKTIWQVREGKRFGIQCLEVFNSYGFNLAYVVKLNSADKLLNQNIIK